MHVSSTAPHSHFCALKGTKANAPVCVSHCNARCQTAASSWRGSTKAGSYCIGLRKLSLFKKKNKLERLLLMGKNNFPGMEKVLTCSVGCCLPGEKRRAGLSQRIMHFLKGSSQPRCPRPRQPLRSCSPRHTGAKQETPAFVTCGSVSLSLPSMGHLCS